ncbi:MAG: hypothetical protein AAF417_15060 [Pseudomonadota bacterium]
MMKPGYALYAAVLATLLYAFPAGATPGPQGPAGPQGPVGATGPAGPQGPAGSSLDLDLDLSAICDAPTNQFAGTATSMCLMGGSDGLAGQLRWSQCGEYSAVSLARTDDANALWLSIGWFLGGEDACDRRTRHDAIVKQELEARVATMQDRLLKLLATK